MTVDAPAPGVGERLNAWLNDPIDPLWERPTPTPRQVRNDVVGALVLGLLAVGVVALTKSMGMVLEGESTWRAYAAVAVMVVPLAMRRRFPLTVLLASSALFVVLSYLSPEASTQIAFQVSYFTALYAAVAWARDRRGLWIAMALVLLAMALWVVVSFTLTSSMDAMLTEAGNATGPLSPLTAAVLYSIVLNFAYFGGAIAFGRSSWRSALQRERLERQAVQIREQSVELARRAVVDERLRIARELHDVVAHHVSVIGVQAGAARKVLQKDPDRAAEALRVIEGASRSAVGEMRSLLGVLRSETHTDRESDSREPGPGLTDLGALVAEHARGGLDVRLTIVAEPGTLDAVPAPVALSLYRVIQESLSNVARHSSAGHARVTLRAVADGEGPGWVEVEIVDDGHGVAGTAGSGYGLRGIRERVALHGGEVEIGPREGSPGWRVRARMPLAAYPAVAASPAAAASAPTPAVAPSTAPAPSPQTLTTADVGSPSDVVAR